MEFGNPIIGQEDLIREAIKSPNFSTDPETGVQGWRIAKDGSATFYNLTIGSPEFTIDENGDAVFNSISAESIILGGESLADLLDIRPRGVIAIVNLTTSTAGFSGTTLAVGEIVIPDFNPLRQYRVSYLAPFDPQTSTPSQIQILARYRWDAAVDVTADPTISNYIGHLNSSTTDNVIAFSFTLNSSNLTGTGTDLRIGFGMAPGINGMRLIGTTYGRIWVEDMGPKVDAGVWTPTVPAVTRYTKTYSASASASFQSDGDNRSVAECYQGYYSSTNGNQFSMIAFPYATIQADLSGATIVKTEIYLKNTHSYSNSGVTAIIGTHNQTSVSGDHPSSQVTDNIDTESFTKGQGKWFTVTNTIGNAFKNNTAKGIALGPAPSTSQSYYAYFAGNGQTGEPQLRITYDK